MDISKPTFEEAKAAYEPGTVSESTGARLALTTKLLYGVGEISNALRSFTFGVFLLFYYTTVLGLPGTLVGIATAINLTWDGVIDPLIGHLSDRTRSRLGHRHPYMIIGAACMGLSFYATFSPPAGLSQWELFAWLLLSNILLRTSTSLFTVPYHALGAELSQGYYERTSITGMRAIFALAGTMGAAALAFGLFFPTTTPGVDPKTNPDGYSAMALAFGLTMMISGLIAAAGTWHKRIRAPVVTREVGKGLRVNLALALRSRSFVVLTISAALFYLGSVINATLAIHYLSYHARIVESSALSAFQLAFYGGGLLGVACWLRIARRVDKHRIYLLSTTIAALILVLAYLLVGEGKLFGTGNVLPLAIGNGIAGFFASALWVLPASMIADTTDEDTLLSGQRHEGAFFGVFSLAQQLAGGLAVFAAGVLLDRVAGLVPGQLVQSAATVERLALLYTLLPAALLALGALLILPYRLTHRRVEMIQQELAARQRAERGIYDA
jgi:glycoside/pentoside/hexuronide:cation symporter, GPH family